MTPPPIVIFDIDGTLTEAHNADGELFFETIQAALGLKGVNQDLAAYFDVTDTGIVHEIFSTHLGRSPAPSELEGLEISFARRLESALGRSIRYREMKGAKAFLERLESRGVAVGVATGNWRKSAAIKLRTLGLERLLPKAMTATDARARKDILRLASRLHPDAHARPGWYVGDGTWDMECAKALGFGFIGVGQRLGGLNLRHWAEDFQAHDSLVTAIAGEAR